MTMMSKKCLPKPKKSILKKAPSQHGVFCYTKSMNKTPFVSVVIPCYNNEQFVGAAIESMLDQTRTPNEIIVCDDASTDNSWQVITDLAQKHPVIKPIQNETNQGIPKTRNNLIAHLDEGSDYMVILDADDVADKQRIEKQLAFFKSDKNLGLVGSDISIINELGVVVGTRVYPHAHNEIVDSILHFNPFAQSSVMTPTRTLSKVGDYDEKLARVQDYDLWIRIVRQGYQVANIGQSLTSFRRHKGQGKETMAKKSVYYSWVVRSRYLFTLQFFSIKGLLFWLGYGVALLVPKDLLLDVYSKLFVKK